ncbi:MAG: dipeptidase [Chloroflexota bacterium]
MTSQQSTVERGTEGARALIPVFDGHNDVLLRIESDIDSFFRHNEEGHIDLPRAQAGGLGGGFCAIFTRSEGERHSHANRKLPKPPYTMPFQPTPDLAAALQSTISGIARLSRLESMSSGALRVIRSASGIEQCLQQGIFAALLHIEGAEAIDADLNALEVFHAAGLRSLGPVWSRPNIFAEGVPFGFEVSPDTGKGLTAAGCDLVRACNRLRIVIDLSHLNEKGFWDVAGLTNAPLVATHSNAWSLCHATRNLTDRQLDAIRESDGMVGVNFCVAFLRPDGLSNDDVTVESIVNHIDYLVERIGIERVGFGSDFDGALVPKDLTDAAGLPLLFDALRNRGYDQSALEKLAHRNWIRVLRKTWGE